MSFGDGIAGATQDVEDKYGKFAAWLFFLGCLLIPAWVGITLCVWLDSDQQTLVGALKEEAAWLWNLVRHRIF